MPLHGLAHLNTHRQESLNMNLQNSDDVEEDVCSIEELIRIVLSADADGGT